MNLLNFIFPNWSASVINILNFGLAAYWLFALRRYRSRILQSDLDDLSTFGKRISNDSGVATSLAALDDLRDDGVLARRLRQLNRSWELNGTVAHDDLAAATVAELDNVLALPRYGASAAVLIGLFGTLVGLSKAVGGGALLVQQGAAGADGMVDRVLAIFGGLSTAFSNTLVGVACTVAVGFYVAWVRHRQAEYVVRLENLTASEILPHFNPSLSSALAQSVKTLTALQSDVTATFTHLLSDLSSGSKHLLSEIESRIGGLEKAAQKSGSEISGQVKHSMNDVVGRLDDLVGQYLKVSQTMIQLIGTPQVSFEPLSDSVGRLQLAAQSSAAAAASAERAIPALGEMLERQADAQTKDVHEALEGYRSATEALRRQQNETIEAVRNLLPSARDEQTGTSDRVATPLSEIVGLLRAISASLKLDQRGTVVSSGNREGSNAAHSAASATARNAQPKVIDRSVTPRVPEAAPEDSSRETELRRDIRRSPSFSASNSGIEPSQRPGLLRRVFSTLGGKQ